MNREIKFRAWFELKNKMVLPENLALCYDGEDGFDFAFDKEFPDEEGNIPGTLCFKLMQYTGLKDKCGKEIFEGDILKRPTEMREETHGNYTHQEVVYRNGTWIIDYLISEKGRILPRGYTAGLLIDCYDQDMKTIVFDDGRLQYTDIEVIGNIYENPELLQESKSNSKREELLKRASNFKVVPGHSPNLNELTDEQLELRVNIMESMFDKAFEEEEDEDDLSSL